MRIEISAGRSGPMKPWPALAGFGKTLALPGGDLFFYDSGAAADDSKPALILIHGLGDEADSWRHLVPLLSEKGFRVIAPDLPGFGRSTAAGNSRWNGRISVGANARAIIDLMRETGAASAQNPAVLVGSSLGAVIAQAIAARQPGLVRALILADGCYPLSGGPDRGLLLTGLPFIGKIWYRGFRKNHEAAWRSLYGYYSDLDAMSAGDKEFLRVRVIDRVESSSQEHAYFASLRSINALSLFAAAQFSRNIKTFPGKIFLVWGEADRVIPLEKTGPFRCIRPDAELQIINGAGHLPHQEAPEKTAEAILNFLKKHLGFSDVKGD